MQKKTQKKTKKAVSMLFFITYNQFHWMQMAGDSSQARVEPHVSF